VEVGDGCHIELWKTRSVQIWRGEDVSKKFLVRLLLHTAILIPDYWTVRATVHVPVVLWEVPVTVIV